MGYGDVEAQYLTIPGNIFKFHSNSSLSLGRNRLLHRGMVV